MASKSSKKQSIVSATKKSNSAIYGRKSNSVIEEPLKADLNANSQANEKDALQEEATNDGTSASNERTWREVCACSSPQIVQNTNYNEEIEVERCVPDYSGIVQRLAHARMLRLIQWNQARTRCRQFQAIANAAKTSRKAKQVRCARKCAGAETDNAVMNECKTNTEVPFGWDTAAGQFCIHTCTKLPGCNCARCRVPAPEFVTPSPPHDFNVTDENTGTGLGFNVRRFPEAPVNLRVVSPPLAPSLEKVLPARSSDDDSEKDRNQYKAYLVPEVPSLVAYPVLRTSNPLDPHVFCDTTEIEDKRRSSVNAPVMLALTSPHPVQNFPHDNLTKHPRPFPVIPGAIPLPLLNPPRALPPITHPPDVFPPIEHPRLPHAFPPDSFPPRVNTPTTHESPPITNPPRAFPPNSYPPRAAPPIANPLRSFPPISYPPRTSLTFQNFPPDNMTKNPQPLAILAVPPLPLSKPPRAVLQFPPQNQNPPLSKRPLIGPPPPLLPPAAAHHPAPTSKVGIPNIPARPPEAHTIFRNPPALTLQTKEHSKLEQPKTKNSNRYRTLGTDNPSCDPIMIARFLRMQTDSTSAAINMLFQANGLGRCGNNAAALLMQHAQVRQHERHQDVTNALQQLFNLARRNFG